MSSLKLLIVSLYTFLLACAMVFGYYLGRNDTRTRVEVIPVYGWRKCPPECPSPTDPNYINLSDPKFDTLAEVCREKFGPK